MADDSNTETLNPQGENPLLVISGGSRGIGAAACRRFLESGYRVVNLSRSVCPVADVKHISVDFTRLDWPESCGDQLSELAQQASSICLIHNSGVMYKDSIFDVSAQALHTAIQVNVVAASQLNQLLIDHMQPGSSILYVASTLAEKAVANTCSYSTSKHAMIGLMRATVQDLFGRAVHSCCICPGFTDTEMLRDHLGNDDEVLQSIAGGVAFNRLITPQEIAETLKFASLSPVLNGAVVHANLGQKEY